VVLAPTPARERSATPACCRALLGWLAAAALLELAPPAPPSAPRPATCTLEQDPPPEPPPSTRAWRSVEGVGAVRALALARARWETGADFDPIQVPGVGPVTARAARLFLERRAALAGPRAGAAASGVPFAPLTGGAYTPCRLPP